MEEQPPHGHPPGYGGYISSVKPENIFGKTYGSITYAINCSGVEKGQDVDVDTRYSSVSRDNFVNQKTIRQRTAAEIVGVIPPPPNYIRVLFLHFKTLSFDFANNSLFPWKLRADSGEPQPMLATTPRTAHVWRQTTTLLAKQCPSPFKRLPKISTTPLPKKNTVRVLYNSFLFFSISVELFVFFCSKFLEK